LEEEWLANLHIVISVEALSSISWSLISIEDFPLLACRVLEIGHFNVLSFFILSIFDIQDFIIVEISDLGSIESKELPPS
jgi:hypothetical protein